MANFLIVYGSKQGQSEKIASAIGEQLRQLGHSADVIDAKSIPATLQLDKYDAVIAGGGVHISGYPRPLRQWVAAHAQTLSTKPTAFFSVCLGILQDDPQVHAEEKKIMQHFFETTGWQPKNSTIFAGALTYSKYNWFLKRVMRSMARRAGVQTDIHRDYEYTNWDEVKRFAREFASAPPR